MLSEKLLKQVAEELALAMNESLPKPEECQHQYIGCNDSQCNIWY